MNLNDEAAPKEVVDTLGERYALGAQLGVGGQGAVYRVVGRPMVAKLVFASGEQAQERVRRAIARVKRLPLDGISVARPLRALAGQHVGYIMELMEDMEPMERIAQLPAALAGGDFLPWYIETGGIERRLRRLAALADIFAQLHARGLTYGDTSPNNVFMSSDLAHDEVCLIDPDNLHDGRVPGAVYTPGYGAPELLAGKVSGTSSLTDAWSLAVLVFETLCVLHPFKGDLVEYGEPELLDSAARGELPWVDDPDETDNLTDRGLPRSLVLTRQLRELAQACFGASRLDPLARPGVTRWAEALHTAADQTLTCSSCGGGFYLNLDLCPWCDAARPAFVLANILVQQRRGDGWEVVLNRSGRPQVVGRVAVQAGRCSLLHGRHLDGAFGAGPWARLDLVDGALRVRASGEAPDHWRVRGVERSRALSVVDELIPLHQLMHASIRSDEGKEVRRVVRFERVEGAR